jgi:group I intron endonuclease
VEDFNMAEAYGIIYKVTNKVNGKVYIGQTIKPLNVRMSGHKSDALNDRNNQHFHKAIKKYGMYNFKWEIIARCYSLNELNKKEKLFIEEHKTFENGYNLTKGGKGTIVCYGEKHPMYNKHLSKEHKQKIGMANRGHKCSEEQKRKISNANKGTILSEETKRKMSMSHKGKKHTEEIKRKIGNAGKGRICSEKSKKRMSEAKVGGKNSRAKKYVIISPDNEKVIIHGIANFCRNYTKEKLNYKILIRVAQGKQRRHRGYECRYYTGT